MTKRSYSVLNREVKQFGKKYMFDRNEETSWNSDQGAIQWLTMEFPQTVQASQIQIQFQGGFATSRRVKKASTGLKISCEVRACAMQVSLAGAHVPTQMDLRAICGTHAIGSPSGP
uniref:Nuclear receptor 2C2 associated protein n=1 Tax=Pseudonaja textilis TaxID=8673 RepID=A0A670Y1B7_PSETE